MMVKNFKALLRLLVFLVILEKVMVKLLLAIGVC